MIVMRDFELLLENPETHEKLGEAQYLEEILKDAQSSQSDTAKLDPMKARIRRYFRNRSLFTLPFPADVDERSMHTLKHLPQTAYFPEFLAQFEQLFGHIARNATVKT